MLALGPIFDIGSKLIDKFFPNPEEKQKAQLELLKMQRDGELDVMKIELSAILAEAQSPDKWTSRARPAFLYVVYILLLAAIPMGIVSAVNPATAMDITSGFRAWLAAIPDPYLQLFGVVMLGYVGARTVEKVKGVAR